MNANMAIAFCEVVTDAPSRSRMRRDRISSAVLESKYLAESLAAQYGCTHQEFTSDGHLFLFESADVAVQFCCRLLEVRRKETAPVVPLEDSTDLPLRMSCHFGECFRLAEGQPWIGRGIQLSKSIAKESGQDNLLITESVLDLIDLSLYRIDAGNLHALDGDHLPNRRLFSVTNVAASPEYGQGDGRDNAESWFLRAVSLLGTGMENSKQEEEYYRKALELRPNYPEALNNLAVLLRAVKDDTASAQCYREALRLRPGYPEAHYNYAVLLQAMGSPGGAMDHYQEALNLRPEYVDAHYGLGSLHSSAGNRESAIHHYEEALRLRPEYADVHNNLAILLEDSGEHQRAHGNYEEALRINPDYPEAHYNYAFLLENEGDSQEAEAHYRHALLLRPDYAEAHNNLAILLQSDGALAEAEEHYNETLRLRPNDPQAHYNYALLLKGAGRVDDSERHFKLAHELAPAEWLGSSGVNSGNRGIPIPNESSILTDRELEVVRLIAVGKSNRDIADDLFISLSTVAHHVTNILNKTDTSNRTEAAAFASRHGLITY